MNLKIDCKNVKITPGTYPDNVTVEVQDETCYDEQLEHYIDYLYDKYGKRFIDEIKDRFDLMDDCL